MIGGHDFQAALQHPGAIRVDLEYPRNDDRPDEIVVSLVDVRAADDLVIRYDFVRDGWAIHQDEVIDRDGRIEVVRRRVEVAFVPAWNEIENPGGRS